MNARIWTADSSTPWAEGIAIAGDSIVAVGTSKAITGLGAKRVIDGGGRMVVPGFIDSHVHLIDGGYALSSVQLRDAKTPAEFVQRIAAFAKTLPAGAWITNGDWDHQNWGGALPDREWVDSVTGDHPLWVNRLDGHMSLANSLALRAAAITDGAKDVAGGVIMRDARGRITGILKDNAQDLVYAKVPPRPVPVEDRALDTAMSYLAARGVTAVQQMGSWSDLAILRRAHQGQRLRMRVSAAVPLGEWRALRDTVARYGAGDAWLRIGSVKGFVDGSLGSHTAAMFQPFTDAPADRGLFVTPPESLAAWTAGADSAGLQVMVHAIGDRAIATQLDIFDRVLRTRGTTDRRFRIEHAQHIAPADLQRFPHLGVIASMQPYHAIDDGRWAEKVIGPRRAATTYAFRSLLDLEGILVFGSDWFVAPPTPLDGIYAAVTRRTLDGGHPDGWVPEQKITVEEALRAYTAHAAYGIFLERQIGMLRPGMRADLVMIDRDLTKIPPAEIRDAKVVLTVIGGKEVFEVR